MPSKLKMARTCLLIQAWLSVAATVLMLLLFLFGAFGISISGGEGSGIASVMFGIMGGVFALVGAVVSALFFVTTKGIKDKKEWAKIVAIVLAAISLTNVPVGTILGILILIGVLDEESNNWFIPTTE